MASAAPGTRLAAATRPPSTRAAAFFRSVAAGAVVCTGAFRGVAVMALIAGAVRAGAARAAVRNALRAGSGCRADTEAKAMPRLSKRVIIGDVLLFEVEFVISTASVAFQWQASVSTH